MNYFRCGGGGGEKNSPYCVSINGIRSNSSYYNSYFFLEGTEVYTRLSNFSSSSGITFDSVLENGVDYEYIEMVQGAGIKVLRDNYFTFNKHNIIAYYNNKAVAIQNGEYVSSPSDTSYMIKHTYSTEISPKELETTILANPPYAPTNSRVIVYNDEAYVFGYDSNTYYFIVQKYSPNTNTWTLLSRQKECEGGRDTTPHILYDDKIYFYYNVSGSGRCSIYDISNNTWSMFYPRIEYAYVNGEFIPRSEMSCLTNYRTTYLNSEILEINGLYYLFTNSYDGNYSTTYSILVIDIKENKIGVMCNSNNTIVVPPNMIYNLMYRDNKVYCLVYNSSYFYVINNFLTDGIVTFTKQKCAIPNNVCLEVKNRIPKFEYKGGRYWFGSYGNCYLENFKDDIFTFAYAKMLNLNLQENDYSIQSAHEYCPIFNIKEKIFILRFTSSNSSYINNISYYEFKRIDTDFDIICGNNYNGYFKEGVVVNGKVEVTENGYQDVFIAGDTSIPEVYLQ